MGATPTTALRSATGEFSENWIYVARAALTSKHITSANPRVYKSAGYSMRLFLDRDAIAIGIWRTGKRVAAHDLRRVCFRTQSKHYELSGKWDDQTFAVRRFQYHRHRIAALAIDSRHPQRPKSRRRCDDLLSRH